MLVIFLMLSCLAITNASDDDSVTPCIIKNQVGVCVLYYQCDKNGYVITDGASLIDERFNKSPVEKCEKDKEWCCLLPKTNPEEPITPAPPTQPPVQRAGCGWRNPNGLGAQTISDSNVANFAEFPWMCAILKKTMPKDELEFLGSASLIHPRVALTVAHKVDNRNENLVLRAGEWDTQRTNEIYPYQERDVAEVHIHKDYKRGNLFYDIAVLFLVSPLTLAPNVGVVCLPSQGERAPSDTRCFTSGWGNKFGKNGVSSVLLKKQELPVVDRNTCRTKLRTTNLGPEFELHTSFMCAKGATPETCTGDGGSPLVCPIEYDEERYMQWGIVAWGGCKDENVPGVYVDVSKFREWIDDKLAGKGYELNTYAY